MALGQLHFCKGCLGEEGPTLPQHECSFLCKRWDECKKQCECGGPHPDNPEGNWDSPREHRRPSGKWQAFR